MRNHPFSACEKCFKKLIFFTPWYAHVLARIGGSKMLVFLESFACVPNEWSLTFNIEPYWIKLTESHHFVSYQWNHFVSLLDISYFVCLSFFFNVSYFDIIIIFVYIFSFYLVSVFKCCLFILINFLVYLFSISFLFLFIIFF